MYKMIYEISLACNSFIRYCPNKVYRKMEFLMKINTLCILGTCSEAIKMAPIIKRLNKDSRFHNQVAVFGQQQDRMQCIFDLFQIRTDHSWNILINDQDRVRCIANILLTLTEFFEQNRPQYLLVLGDTITAVAAAIAAYYHHIPIGHIEAGLRTGDQQLAWPEEVHRKLVGDLANIHFAPTFSARQNLLREGIASDAIYVTGSTAMDALFDSVTYIRKNEAVQAQMRQSFAYLNPTRKMIFVTGPKKTRDNQELENICQSLCQIAQKFPEVELVYLVDSETKNHSLIHKHLDGIQTIFIIEPVDYLACVYLIQSSYFVITDSGWIQELAPSLDKPVLLMRKKTEYPEAIDAGTVSLVGTEINEIVFEATRLLKNQSHYQQMSQAVSPYGDGKSAVRIVETLAQQAKLRNKTKEYA